MSSLKGYFSKASHTSASAAIVLMAAQTHAAIPISNTPLFLTSPVAPNLVVTLDDSLSMARAYVPETCGGVSNDCPELDNRYAKSSYANPAYYNPNVRYPQARNADGSLRPTSFTAAYRNGFDTAYGTPVNLSNNYAPTAEFRTPFGLAVIEGFMGHYTSDSRRNSGNCEISNGLGGWAVGQPGTSSTTCRGPDDNNPVTADTTRPGGVPAYYYNYDDTNSGCTGTTSARMIDNDCYDIKLVTNSSGPGTVDLNGNGIVGDAGDSDEQQNFANWFSFARTRNLATITAASLAFQDVSASTRVAWHALTTCRGSATSLVDVDCDGWKNNFSGVSNAINNFAGTHKSNFFNWLFQLPSTTTTTPLPESLKRAGEYFKTTGENSPYDDNFATASSEQQSCRKNYHMMMTDGMWNPASAGTKTDSGTYTLPVAETDPAITQYVPAYPYADSTSGTLADLAFEYWITDLTSLANDVEDVYRDRSGDPIQQYWNAKNDPARWQHMVNFTFGFGLNSYLSATGLTWTGDMYGGSYPNLVTGPLLGGTAWPAAASGGANTANVSDLWHAAINSRGQFFSADNPEQLSQSFQAAIAAISGTSGASAALSANSTSIQAGSTVIYQARFDPGWSGALVALPIDNTGAVGAPVWDASARLPAPAVRKIFTHNGSVGIPFVSTACSFTDAKPLNASQRLSLNTNSFSGVVDSLCVDRVNWLRGDTSKETRNGGSFRNRPPVMSAPTITNVMGDIVNSDPAYVKNVDYGYATSLPIGTPGRSEYAAYVSANASRTPMVYVGSNDGRMYAIEGTATSAATSGVEIFSYVPGGTVNKLNKLTSPTYAHEFYVDGPVTARDVYIGGSWKTVVIGGLNAGGNTIYALDVTDPTTFGETNVMWEFSDADMGLSYSKPQIGVSQSGDWVVVFGNGYNSTNGGAYLYVVDLATGVLLQKIAVRDQDATDESNGLSTPLLYDTNGDGLFGTIYVGDLLGNMWKINAATAPGTWGLAFGGTPTGTAPSSVPLYQARNASNQIQPITSQPKAASHPISGVFVVFGTGRYLSTADVSDSTVQSFYGVRDTSAAITTTDRSELQAQSFDVTGTVSGIAVRSLTSNTINWTTQKGWYLDLVTTTPEGERFVATPRIKYNRLLIVTIIPSTDPCEPGGTSWITDLELYSGASPAQVPFDFNGDGVFNSEDKIGGTENASSFSLNLGISNTPITISTEETDGAGVITVNECEEFIGLGGAGTTDVETIKRQDECNDDDDDDPNPVSRRYWIQIR